MPKAAITAGHFLASLSSSHHAPCPPIFRRQNHAQQKHRLPALGSAIPFTSHKMGTSNAIKHRYVIMRVWRTPFATLELIGLTTILDH